MGYVKTGSAVLMTVGMLSLGSGPVVGLGAWDCARVENAVVQAEREQEAMMSQRFVVAPDGRVEIVKIHIEEPYTPTTVYERIVDEVLVRLGLRKRTPEVVESKERIQRTALETWAMSPARENTGLELPTC